MADMNEEQQTENPAPEVEVQAEPKRKPGRPRKGENKAYKHRGARGVEGVVMVMVPMPRRIHDELKRFAVRTRMNMPRLLIETFLESLPPELAQTLRETLGPISAEQRKLENKLKDLLKKAKGTCPECRKTHEHMPGAGPWHMPDCGWYRTRPTVIVDGEKE